MLKHEHPARVRAAVLTLILLLVPVTGLLTACSRSEASVIVAGSTSVQPFAEILSEEYTRLHPGVSIDVQGGGSSAGVRAVQTDTAGIGMSSRDLKGDEKTLWSVEIAKDGLALIVHASNPVSNLSLGQIRDIYAGVITNWSQVGGRPGQIHLFTREEGSGTRDAFTSLVMNKVEITDKALVQDSNGAVRQLVSDDPNAIGYISLGLVNTQVKALAMGGIAATHDNVANGSYKLARPFLFLSHSAPAGTVKAFIDFVLSADGQKILNAEGLVTLTGGGSK